MTLENWNPDIVDNATRSDSTPLCAMPMDSDSLQGFLSAIKAVENDNTTADDGFCLFDADGDAQINETAERIMRTIARAGGLGNNETQAALRRLFQDEVGGRQGDAAVQRLQGVADAANRMFEENRHPYYIGVSNANTIVLYTPQGLRTLELRLGR